MKTQEWMFTPELPQFIQKSLARTNSFAIACPKGSLDTWTSAPTARCRVSVRFPPPGRTHALRWLFVTSPLSQPNPCALNCFTVPVPLVPLAVTALLGSPGILFQRDCPAAPQPPAAQISAALFKGSVESRANRCTILPKQQDVVKVQLPCAFHMDMLMDTLSAHGCKCKSQSTGPASFMDV